jgi:gliding motility-associated lipoprotein GldD
MKKTIAFLGLSGLLLLFSCGGGDYVPKPKGYFRIDLPKKQYVVFDSTCPYTFERPVYSVISPDKEKDAEPYWINIDFPKYKGRVHISYKSVKHNLAQYAEDSYTLVMKHISKANNIDDKRIDIPEDKVYGIIYTIEGTGAASTYQFFVTDSVTNFVRGALYFNIPPNNDSLAPVIDFIKEDLEHLIKTFHWKKIND